MKKSKLIKKYIFLIAIYFAKEQHLTPAIEKRLFVIDLLERQRVTRAILADSLCISRQSINNWGDKIY